MNYDEIKNRLRPLVFAVVDNAKANGYESCVTSEAEAEEILDQDADVERLCEDEFGDDVEKKIKVVATLVREAERRKPC